MGLKVVSYSSVGMQEPVIYSTSRYLEFLIKHFSSFLI